MFVLIGCKAIFTLNWLLFHETQLKSTPTILKLGNHYFNPLIPKSDQYVNSLYKLYFNTLSRRQVTRINKIII